jgi:hypothetical protein
MQAGSSKRIDPITLFYAKAAKGVLRIHAADHHLPSLQSDEGIAVGHG